MQESLLAKADELERRSIFLGGPRKRFIAAGRCQLEILLAHGLTPDDFVLDVGCGALRGGWWVMNFLRPERYFGIEPSQAMLEAGKEIMVGAELLSEKKPHFSNNDNFDFSVFGQKFDFVMARSVWTHASKDQILKMLQQFKQYSNTSGCFLATIIEPRLPIIPEYRGSDWIGRSHKSDIPGIAHYRFGTLKAFARDAGLKAERLDIVEGQRWVKITHA